jgi:cytochrome P450
VILEETIQKLVEMKMPAMAAMLREMNTTPRTEPLSTEETIGLLVDREWTQRENTRLHRLLKDARVPSGVSVEEVACVDVRCTTSTAALCPMTPSSASSSSLLQESRGMKRPMPELLLRLPHAELAGPKAMPIAGTMGNFMRFFSDPVGVLLRLRRDYGDIAALSRGDAAWVAAFGAAHNQTILSDALLFPNFGKAPMKLPKDSAASRLDHMLTSMNGEQHRRHRRLMMPAFNKPAIAGYFDETVKMADRVIARWSQGSVVDVRREMSELALCVAMKCLYAVDLLEDADELGALSVGLLDSFSVGAVLFPFNIPGTPYARFLTMCDRFEKRLQRLIADHRAHAKDGRDVLSLLIQARDDDGSGLGDDELVSHAGLLFMAGHETTANTLAWTLMLLAEHPSVRQGVEDELDAVLRGAAPTIEDIARLPLLDAVVKESMRVLPAAAIMFFRRASGAFRLGDLELPKDSTVLLSPLVTHRDERMFPDPLRFQPERWAKMKPTAYEYLPFGAGPRLCLGAPFATQAIRVLLAMMMQRHRFDLLSCRVDRRVRGITLGIKRALPMKLSPRTSSPPPAPRLEGDIHELVTLPR